MKLKIAKEIVLAIILAYMVSNLTPAKTQAFPETTFFVEPPSIVDVTKTPGSTITVQVKVTEADYIYSWQVRVDWTSTIMSTAISQITFGGFLTDQPEGSITNIRVESGWLVVSEATKGSYLGKSAAEGLLFSITFSVIGTGETDITINDDSTYYLKCSTVPVLIKTYPTRTNGYFSNTGLVQYTLTISVDGLGTTDPAPGTHDYDQGTAVPVAAFPNSGYMLDHWTLDDVEIGSANPYTLTVNADHTLVAVFVEVPPGQYQLTIQVAGSGTTDPAVGVHSFDEDSEVDVTALPDPGWMLDHWELDTVNVGSENPYTVTMDMDHTLKAIFAEAPVTQHTLKISVVGSGTTSPAPGDHLYDENTPVTVDAIPDSGWTLEHWELDDVYVGATNPYTATMNTDHTLKAVFIEVPFTRYTLTISVDGLGTTDPASGVHTYEEGTVADVTAVPDGGWAFDHWELDGTDVGNANPNTVVMDTDHALSALFILSAHPTVDESPPTAYAGEDRTVNVGQAVTFDASSSMDDVGIVSFEWDLGDGTRKTGISTTHVYEKAGTYSVTLTVKDAAGNTDSHSVTITVLEDSAPILPIVDLFWVGVVAIVITLAVGGGVLWRNARRGRLPSASPM